MALTRRPDSGASTRPNGTPAAAKEPRWAWALAGLVAGAAGLATSYLAAAVLAVRESPVVAVGELIIRLTPGWLVELAIRLLAAYDKPVLVIGILLVLVALFAEVGLLARRSWWAAGLLLVVLAAVGATAVLLEPGAGQLALLPVVVGLATWVAVLGLLTAPLRSVRAARSDGDDAAEGHGNLGSADRRLFLVGAAVALMASGATGALGRVVGRGRRQVEEARRLLRLPGVTKPRVPADVSVQVDGVTPWLTRAEDFYLIHTALVVPTIRPEEWSLRVHGLVDRELRLSYDDLVGRRRTESWITLNCVSNTVGGDLIGNAWWSGVRLADLLAEAGPAADADAVLQTSDDGWTCATPLSALTDGRNAMLAIAMNGRPLPIEHGFPVRSIVPGLYGYVSATKWVVDLEVARFADVSAYWTERGWSEQGPVKLASRVDVPGSGDEVAAGAVRVAGVAWSQHTGVEAVEVALDGDAWQRAELAGVPNDDCWVQWAASVDVAPGDHQLRVRAIDKQGQVQTGAEQSPRPDGATGWHSVDFVARA